MNKTNLLIDLAQRAVGGIGCPLRAVAQDVFKIRLVLHEPFGLLADGAQRFHNGLAHGGLERTVANAVKFGLDLVHRLTCTDAVDLHKVRYAQLFGAGIHAVAGLGVVTARLKQRIMSSGDCMI